MKKMKKITAVVLSILMILTVLPVVSLAETWAYPPAGVCGDDIIWKYENGVLTFSGTGYIDNQLSSSQWDRSEDSVTSVVISEGITRTGEWLCASFGSMKTLSLPDSLFAVDNYSFSDCSALTSISFGSGLKAICNGAFSGCCSLTSVTVPGNVRRIGVSAFAYCTNLTSVTIENGVTDIEYYAFNGCTALTSLTIPYTVTSIGKDATKDCENVTVYGYTGSPAETYAAENGIPFVSLGVSPAVPRDFNGYCGPDITWKYTPETNALTLTGTGGMENYWFEGFAPPWVWLRDQDGSDIWPSISTVELSEGITEIGSNSFYYFSRLASITLPDTLKIIGSSAFRYCERLSFLNIPDGVTCIENEAFIHCWSLTSVTVPKSVRYIGVDAFKDCPVLTLYGYKNTVAEQVALKNNIPFVALDEEEHNAFSGDLGDNITWSFRDGVLTFAGTGKMENFNSSAFSYGSVPPWLYENSGITEQDITGVVIGDGITSIGADIFKGLTSLTSVTIPESVSVIGPCAFGDCTSLQRLILPESVQVIAEYSFSGCPSLTVCVAPGSFAETYAVWYRIPFLYLWTAGNYSGFVPWMLKDGILTVTSEISIPSFDAQYSAAPWLTARQEMADPSINQVVIGDGTTAIGAYTFSFIDELTSVYIPSTVRRIDADAFAGSTNVTIYGYENSAAEAFAEMNHIPFVSVGTVPGEPDAPEEPTTFIGQIKAFFNKIIEWFRNLFR